MLLFISSIFFSFTLIKLSASSFVLNFLYKAFLYFFTELLQSFQFKNIPIVLPLATA